MKRNLVLKRDKDTTVPTYQVFANHIEDMIVCGDFKPGERLPTEVEFCGTFWRQPFDGSAGYSSA